MNAREFLLKFLPGPVAAALKIVKRHYLLVSNSVYDYGRYARYSSSVKRGDTEEKLRALITIHYHSIEKGLSLPSPRPGFGKAAIKVLLEHIDQYLQQYGPASHLSIPLNALQTYVTYNQSRQLTSPELVKKLDQLTTAYEAALGSKPEGGGVKAMTRDQILRSVQGVGADFFMDRYSIRQFAPEEVPIETIAEAIRRAQKAPAVCNRQSGRAWVISNSTDVQDVLNIQGGARGFASGVNKVIVVTSDLCNFQSAGERYQSWIDGGLFAMSLIYALHSMGLGTCALNWSMEYQKDRELKSYLAMSQTENVIMLIAVGTLPVKFSVAASQRKQLDEVMVKFDRYEATTSQSGMVVPH
jgi:nitroreductase